jgi:hypothetical protein
MEFGPKPFGVQFPIFSTRVYTPSCLPPTRIPEMRHTTAFAYPHLCCLRYNCIGICPSFQRMAKHLYSSMSLIVNGLANEPWVRPRLRLDANIQLRSCHLPHGLETCWEINRVEAANLTCSPHLPPCGACLVFHQDKDLFAHL